MYMFLMVAFHWCIHVLKIEMPSIINFSIMLHAIHAGDDHSGIGSSIIFVQIIKYFELLFVFLKNT